jgi:hypothetical protein
MARVTAPVEAMDGVEAAFAVTRAWPRFVSLPDDDVADLAVTPERVAERLQLEFVEPVFGPKRPVSVAIQ